MSSPNGTDGVNFHGVQPHMSKEFSVGAIHARIVYR